MEISLFFFLFLILWQRADAFPARFTLQCIWGLAGGARPCFWLCHSAKESETFGDYLCVMLSHDNSIIMCNLQIRQI